MDKGGLIACALMNMKEKPSRSCQNPLGNGHTPKSQINYLDQQNNRDRLLDHLIQDNTYFIAVIYTALSEDRCPRIQKIKWFQGKSLANIFTQNVYRLSKQKSIYGPYIHFVKCYLIA